MSKSQFLKKSIFILVLSFGFLKQSSAQTTFSCFENNPAGAIANYKLDGNANDALGLNQGTFQGTTAFTTNRLGVATKAYNLNGTTSFMSTATQFSPGPQQFTLSLWFKTNSTAGTVGGALIGFTSDQVAVNDNYQHDRQLYMAPNGRIYFGVFSGSPVAVRTVVTPGSYNDAKWHHVTGVLSSTGMSLYIDGVLLGSGAAINAAEVTNGYWRIGNMRTDRAWPGYEGVSGVVQSYFRGAIDDVNIYHTALTAAQVTELYKPTFSASSTGPVCAGSSFSLSATAFAGATYAWSGPNGFTSTEREPLAIQLTNARAGIYTVTVNGTGCSETASTEVKFNETDPGLWAGKIDENWENADNWCAGKVPTTATNVTIPTTGPIFNPTLTGVGSANNIIVQTGRTLIISGAGNLQVAGSITSVNLINTTNGKVTLNGTAAQQIPSNVFSSNSIKDLAVNNTAGVGLNGALRLTGVLTPSAGRFLTNGNLTLASTATSTANVAAMPTTASVRGSVKVERFVTGGTVALARTSRMLSSPVYDNSTSFISNNVEGNRSAKFSQLIDDIIISNSAGAAAGFDVTPTNLPGAWTYSSGFQQTSNINTSVNAGRGMYVFFRGNRTSFNNKVNPPFADPEDTVIDFDGILNQQAITVNLPTGGSLVGNPYAATIDWDSPNWGTNKSTLDNAIWIWKPSTRSYATYINGVPTLGASRYIGSGQAFFVRKTTTGAGSITFTENIKAPITQQPPTLLMSIGEKQTVGFVNAAQVSSSANPQSIFRISMKPLDSFGEDETVMVFDKNSSAELNEQDALHMDGEVVNLATWVNNRKVAINFTAPVTESMVIPLHVTAKESGSYLLNFNLAEYQDRHALILKDNQLNITTPITAGLVYRFELDKNDKTTFGADRFSISFEAPTTLPVTLSSFTAVKVNDGVSLKWNSATETNHNKFEVERAGDDQVFKKLQTITAKGSGAAYSYLDRVPLFGNNYYRLVQISNDNKLDTTSPVVINYTGNVQSELIAVFPNPVQENFTVKYNGALKGTQQTLKIVNATGQVMLTKAVAAAALTSGVALNVGNYAAGLYIIEIYEDGNHKVGQVKLIKK